MLAVGHAIPMKTLILASLFAFATYAQTTNLKVVKVPENETLPIIQSVGDFYKAIDAYNNEAKALEARRLKALNDLRTKVQELTKKVETKYECEFNLDTYICTKQEKK